MQLKQFNNINEHDYINDDGIYAVVRVCAVVYGKDVPCVSVLHVQTSS